MSLHASKLVDCGPSAHDPAGAGPVVVSELAVARVGSHGGLPLAPVCFRVWGSLHQFLRPGPRKSGERGCSAADRPIMQWQTPRNLPIEMEA